MVKAMIDWVGLRVDEMSIAQCKDLYEKGKDDYAAFVKDWIFRKLETELGFSPEKKLDLWVQPHLYGIELMSFVMEFTNKGLNEIDWIIVGHEFKK
jgi:hypothetical protein